MVRKFLYNCLTFLICSKVHLGQGACPGQGAFPGQGAGESQGAGQDGSQQDAIHEEAAGPTQDDAGSGADNLPFVEEDLEDISKEDLTWDDHFWE